MLIDRIYKKVKTFVNTDVRGNVTPAEFNLFLHDAIQERQNELIELINQHQNRENRGLSSKGIENQANKYRDILNYYASFQIVISNAIGQITIPPTVVFIDSISDENDNQFEQCLNYKEFKTLKSLATTNYPLSIQLGKVIETNPRSINKNIGLSFIRKPIVPNWTYEVINDNEFFNSGHPNFRDADAHPSDEDVLVIKVLKRFGVNLKENEITAIASQTEQTNYQKELTT